MNYICFSLCLLFSLNLWAGPNAATLVFKKGDVQFFTKPSKKARGTGNEVLFESIYFKMKPAKIGRKLKVGEAIKVGPNGKAKLNFSNGDHFLVDAGTTYRLEKSKKGKGKKKGGSILNLYYGKIRGVVSKNGRRKNLKIKTPSAVAGVRGTDFFVNAKPEGTEVTVLRGQVNIEKVDGVKKDVVIKKGMTAVVKKPKKVKKDEPQPVATLETKEATKRTLVDIHKSSMVNVKKELAASDEKISKKVMAEITQLEKKATKVVVDDIKIENPELAKKMAAAGDNVAEMNTAVVSNLYKKAPAEPKEKKLLSDDLETLDEDVYKKYFSN